MERPPPADAARQIVQDRYANAAAAILAGSVTTGRATPTSDLDLVVIAPDDPEVPYRESFHALGWPVEAFLHDESSLEGFYRLDAHSGTCTLATMVSTGIVIVDDDGSAARLREQAQAVIDGGPPPMADDELLSLRYIVTDLLDDLRGDPSGDESAIVGPMLASQVGTLVLASRGSWRGNGKWLLRQLRTADADLADRLVLSLRAHQAGNAGPLISLAEHALDLSGGRMFDGYRPSGKRLLAAGRNEDPPTLTDDGVGGRR